MRHSRASHRSATARLRRLFDRSRPRFWFYTAGPVLVGVAYGATSSDQLITPLTVALFAYFLVPANVYLYGVNDVFDAAADAVNPKKGGSSGSEDPPDEVDAAGDIDAASDVGATGEAREVRYTEDSVDAPGDVDATGDAREVRYTGDSVEGAAVVACGLLGAALLAVVPAGAVPWVAGFLVLGTAYSAPPLRLKTVPLLDSASNGLYVLPGVAAYVAVAGEPPPLLAVAGGWLWTMAMHTFSAIPDVEPDREAGLTTTATLLGERRTLAYCGVVWTFAALAFAALDVRAGALLALYPLLVVGIAVADVDVGRAYWWYPAVNTLVGMVLTLAGLWGVVHG